MTTLLELVQKPTIADLKVADYDFEEQTRQTDGPVLGWSTSGTVATYDTWGKPQDSRNDED